MIIPIDQVSQETLQAIIESFVLREGTDYGEDEVNLADKISEVKQQLMQGDAVLVYSELYETVDIVSADRYQE